MTTSESLQRVAISVLATAVLAFILLGVPLVFVGRFASGMSGGFQGQDGLLLVGLYAWVVASLAMLQRNAVPEGSIIVPAFFHQLFTEVVEVSFLGAGTFSTPLISNPHVDTAWLVAPTFDEAMLAPKGVRGIKRSASSANPGLPDGADLVVLRRRQKKESILAGVKTTTYEVQRGDTWWSLAEHFVSDGRKWKDLRDINIGHSPAADVVIDERANATPLIGWQILVPAEIIEPAEEVDEEKAGNNALLDAALGALDLG